MRLSKQDEEALKKLKESVDNYTTTVSALLCFASLATWDGTRKRHGSHHSFGRKMTTINQHEKINSVDLTPDLVIQVNDSEGYVCEAKKTLSKEKRTWNEVIAQIQKYDDNLKGWWTEDGQLPYSNAILLIGISRSKVFKDHTMTLLKGGKPLFKKSVAFVEFTRADEANQFIFFRTIWGKVDNVGFDSLLSEGKMVPTEKVIATYGNKKFYDAEPETEFLMTTLWIDIFTPMKNAVEFNAEKKAWPLQVTIDSITTQLQKLYGNTALEPREVAFPKHNWVKKAFDKFEYLDLAEQTDAENYTIFYKTLKGDLLLKFLKAKKKKSKHQQDTEQPSLFDNQDTHASR